jgi:hypothetical protein
MLAQENEIAASCVPTSQAEADLPEEAFWNPEALQAQLLSNLNEGVSLEAIDEAMSQRWLSFYEFRLPYLWQLVAHDMTGDSTPEIFFAVTIPAVPGHGDSYLFMFTCADDRYEGRVIWGQGGAGISGEGIYEGGGTRVIGVRDFNNNGLPDLLFKVGWLWNFGDGDRPYAEYYLLEWENGEWRSLVDELGDLGETQFFIDSHTYDDVGVVDTDHDDINEIIVDGQVYQWDGEMYVLDDEG